MLSVVALKSIFNYFLISFDFVSFVMLVQRLPYLRAKTELRKAALAPWSVTANVFL